MPILERWINSSGGMALELGVEFWVKNCGGKGGEVWTNRRGTSPPSWNLVTKIGNSII
jgi:hypothetical protein